MLRRLFFTAVTVVISGTSMIAVGAEKPQQSPGWGTSEFQLVKDGPCNFELAAANGLVMARDSGKTQEVLISQLPPRSQSSLSQEALIEYSVIDDIYGNPAVAKFPYFVYRNITCMRHHSGKQTPPNLSAVSLQVLACQHKFGVEASDHLIACIQAAVLGGVL
jgi:hypothetical protein